MLGKEDVMMVVQ